MPEGRSYIVEATAEQYVPASSLASKTAHWSLVSVTGRGQQTVTTQLIAIAAQCSAHSELPDNQYWCKSRSVGRFFVLR